MTDTKNLLQFPPTESAQSSDWIHISQGGVDKKISLDNFITELNGGNPFNVTVKEESSTARTLTVADINSYIVCTNANLVTITLNTDFASSLAIGQTVVFKKEGLGDVLISGGAGITVNPSSSGVVLTELNQAGQIIYRGSNKFDFLTGGNGGAVINGTPTFLTLSTMIAGTTVEGYSVDFSTLAANNAIGTTVWNNSTSKADGSNYIFKTLTQAAIDGDVIDGDGVSGRNHAVGGTYCIILQFATLYGVRDKPFSIKTHYENQAIDVFSEGVTPSNSSSSNSIIIAELEQYALDTNRALSFGAATESYDFDSVISSRVSIHGSAAGNVILNKMTNNLGGSENVDCVISVDPKTTGGYATGTYIKGLMLTSNNPLSRSAYGLYAKRISGWQGENIILDDFGEGLWVGDGFQCGLSRGETNRCGTGVNIRSGTSFNISKYWAKDSEVCGFKAYNLSYSSWDNAAVDRCGVSSGFGTAFYIDSGCDIVMSGCGCEAGVGVRVRADFAEVAIIGWDDIANDGVPDANIGALQITGSSCKVTLINSKFRDYATSTTMANYIANSNSTLTTINSSLPGNGSTFPGTTQSHGVDISGSRVGLRRDSTNAFATFEVTGVGSGVNGSVISHGMGSEPDAVIVTPLITGATAAGAISGGGFTLSLQDLSGAPITTSTPIAWRAVLETF